jgi:probable rRNA maturation factor
MTNRLYLTTQYASRPKHWPVKTNWTHWMSGALEYPQAYVTLRLVGQEEGFALNQSYRKKDYATNILSFSYNDSSEKEVIYGDLVLCVPVIEQEAKDQKKELFAHLAHLVIHGMLHLQNYDHEHSEEAEIMEQKEIELLNLLGYPNPYE